MRFNKAKCNPNISRVGDGWNGSSAAEKDSEVPELEELDVTCTCSPESQSYHGLQEERLGQVEGGDSVRSSAQEGHGAAGEAPEEPQK